MASSQPWDCVAHRCDEFEKFMLTHKFIWDNELGVGRTILFDRTAIQRGTPPVDAGVAASTIPHGESGTQRTDKPARDSSPRLEFLKRHSIAPILPPFTPRVTSTSPSPSPHSLSQSTTLTASSTSGLPLFTTEYFEVLRSTNKGYGAFALRDIERGTLIMSERPLFKARISEVYVLHEQLTQEERREYATLWGWERLDRNPIMSRFLTNRFTTGYSACGIFLKSSRFNHACYEYRKCSYRYDKQRDRLDVTTICPIKKGEEITITYDRNVQSLFENYGFQCDCPGCLDSGSESVGFPWLSEVCEAEVKK